MNRINRKHNRDFDGIHWWLFVDSAGATTNDEQLVTCSYCLSFLKSPQAHKRIAVCIAAPTDPTEAVPTFEIRGEIEFPGVQDLADAELLHEQMAQKLADALIESLPGGTLYRLMGKLLMHYANLHRVPDLPIVDRKESTHGQSEFDHKE